MLKSLGTGMYVNPLNYPVVLIGITEWISILRFVWNCKVMSQGVEKTLYLIYYSWQIWRWMYLVCVSWHRFHGGRVKLRHKLKMGLGLYWLQLPYIPGCTTGWPTMFTPQLHQAVDCQRGKYSPAVWSFMVNQCKRQWTIFEQKWRNHSNCRTMHNA